MAADPEPPLDLPEAPSCASTAVTSVFVTLLVVALLEALAYFLWKIYWRGKSGQHLVLVTDTEKGDLFAYDNPGFKEGPSLVPQVEKEHHKENHNLLKWPQWASIGLLPNNNKVKAMDDTFTTQPMLVVVPLRSHDFTGLGFNICGNMRDGIFIKDVLHRGPASESGNIIPGDRIESLKISLRHMVFEDALTILSYASPYEVELAVEKRSGSRVSTLVRNPPPPHKICHPFYKSHSISDLHQIEKSNSKRSGEAQTSMLTDLSGEVGKSATLEKPKTEAERYQNSKNCFIENVQKQENVFHTIDLDETDRSRESSSPSNMKNILVKGIQNLKEKLHNTLHQDEEKGSSGSPSRTSTLDKKKSEVAVTDEGFQAVELTVPDEVTKAGQTARSKRQLILDETMELIIDCEEIEKKGKRKAPMPPQVTETDENKEMTEDEVTDSDLDVSGKSGTIELDSSHITVHQADNEGRKASSLGDLSRYESDNITVLERAVSLDLADGGSISKKRKAPLPPQDSSLVPYKEARLDVSATGTLKKSDVWGTLEDVLQTSDSETDLGISGCSTPEKGEIQLTSTPFKFSNLDSVTDTAISSSVQISNCSWDLSMVDSDRSQYITTVNGNSTSGEDTPPQLPTSPIPTIDSYVTEIQVISSPSVSLPSLYTDTETSLYSQSNNPHTPEPVEGSKFSIVEIDTNESSEDISRQSSSSTEASRSPRSNVSVTSVKTGTSRIPVRAGQRSPGAVKHSPQLRRLPNRNGHHSPEPPRIPNRNGHHSP